MSTNSQTDELVLERRDTVLVARLNRPDARNALTPGLITGLANAVADAEADAGIRAVVITGTGDGAFCAGMDLRGFDAGGDVSLDDVVMRRFLRLLEGDVTVPIVGAA